MVLREKKIERKKIGAKEEHPPASQLAFELNFVSNFTTGEAPLLHSLYLYKCYICVTVLLHRYF